MEDEQLELPFAPFTFPPQEPVVDLVECVKEFNNAMGATDDPRVWHRLVEEEFSELAEELFAASDNVVETDAWAANVLKELVDLNYVLVGYAFALEKVGASMSKEYGERVLTLIRYAEPMFRPEALNKAVYRVHQSNMSKLGADGKPVRREDGKIMKGPNYKPPNLLDLVA